MERYTKMGREHGLERSMVLLLLALAVLAVALPLLQLSNVAIAVPSGSTRSSALASAAASVDGAVAIAAGGDLTCTVLEAGEVRCWGAGSSGQWGNAGTQNGAAIVSGLDGNVLEVSAGSGFACARLQAASGAFEVACWGANPGGALGDGASEASASAVRVVDGAGAIANVSVGRAHACAVVDGTVRCWGSNWFGELGTGAAGERAMAPVDLKLPAQKVVAGARHTCALLTEGGVRCWGDGSSGQVGDGNLREENASPVDVQGLGSSVVDISAGGEHTCALLADGRVQCWGANWWGQLGEGTTALRNRPVFAAIKDVVAISAGGGHTCAVTSSGAAYCWGDNAHGQLGDGAWEDQASPVPVIGLESGVVAIATGSAHTCALLQSGVTRCWGSNAGGLPGASGA